MMVARWLSIIFHPFAMVGVMVGAAAAARQTRGEAVRSVGVVALFTIVPLAVLMWCQVRRGRWENADASNRAERPILYIVGGIALVALLAYLLVLRPQSFMVRGVVATLAATALALMRSPAGYVLLLALPAIVWSRLILQRHTPLEAGLGAIIGAGAGMAIHYL